MSSGLLESLRRNVGLRLSLLYALIFSLSSVALLALAYYLLAAAVGSKDREVLEARLKEAAVVYEAGGVIGLRSWVASQPAEVQNTMFVRLVNPADNTALVISAPRGLGRAPGCARLGRLAQGCLTSASPRTPNGTTPWAGSSFRTAGSCRLAGRPTAAKPS